MMELLHYDDMSTTGAEPQLKGSIQGNISLSETGLQHQSKTNVANESCY